MSFFDEEADLYVCECGEDTFTIVNNIIRCGRCKKEFSLTPKTVEERKELLRDYSFLPTSRI